MPSSNFAYVNLTLVTSLEHTMRDLDLGVLARSTNIAIAGHDFQVGAPSTGLKSYLDLPRTATAPISYDVATNRVLIRGEGAVLDGFDLRGTSVFINANNVSIKNSAFDAASGFYSVMQANGRSGLSIDQCSFDGLKLNKHFASFVTGGTGQVTIENSTFRNAPSDALMLMNGAVRNNMFEGAGYLTDAHADAIWVPRTTGPVLIEGNLIDWRMQPDAVAMPNNIIRISPDFGAVNDVTVQKNIMIGGTVAVLVSDSVKLAQSGPISNVKVIDNIIGGNAFGDLYPLGKPSDLVFKGNSVLVPGVTQLEAGDTAFVTPQNAILVEGRAGRNGTSANDVLVGSDAQDWIHGGAGNDTIVGGGGRDFLTGGGGRDTFVYAKTADATDHIGDFRVGEDRIDLSRIDANVLMSGNQAFQFIAQDRFSGQAGQLRFDFRGANTAIEGDVNGDRIADFRIDLAGRHILSANDIVL